MSDVIILGGGVSGLSAAFEARKQGLSPLVLEAGLRCGGVLSTHRTEGYVMEEGAESMLASKPAARELCRELGIEDQLITTQEGFRGSLIVHRGELHPVPEGFRLMAPRELWPMVTSPLFSLWGKLRMACELVIPRRHSSSDESLADFVRRRLGQECLERIAQPMAAGIFTADPEELSMQAAFAQFVDFERRHGSVIRGLWKSTGLNEGAAGPRYALFETMRDGMGRLIDQLVKSLEPGQLLCDSAAQSIEYSPSEGSWSVRFRDQVVSAPRLVLALPAHASARLLASVDAALASELAAIPYLSSATVNLSYPLALLGKPTQAYGFVVPAVERMRILACTYSHRKYPGRCPADAALLRAYLGGAHDPDAVERSDSELIADAHRDLSRLLAIQCEPMAAHVWRGHKGMPVYQVGHLRRATAIESLARKLPGLGLTGNYLRGVGIPDCIRLGRKTMSELIAAAPTPVGRG